MRLPPGWRDLALVILNATVVGMTIALTVPLLTLNLERAGADPLTIGLNSAAGGLGIFLVGPFIGRLAARFGVVGCFRAALLVCVACTLLFALWVDPWYWSAVRLVYGCASALMFVLNEAAVNGLVGDERRGRVLGVYAALFTVGYAGGPLLLALAGTEGWLPFALAGALLLGPLLLTIPLRAAEDRLRLEEGGRRHKLLDVWRAAPLAMAAIFVYAFVEGSAFALMPVWALDIGLSAGAAAAMLGVFLAGNIVLQLPVGWLSDRARHRHGVVAGCALASAAGLLLLPLATGTPAALWPLLLLVGGLTGGLYTLALTLLGDRFRGPDLTVANTAFVMTFQVGMVAGPPLVGGAMWAFGEGSFPVALVPALAGLGVGVLVWGRGAGSLLPGAGSR